jgi:serine/threonine protein kinase
VDVKRYPSGSLYVEALQNPGICFREPILQSSKPDVDKLGRPRPISGNFASVFSVTSSVDAKRYAIKCFTRYVADQEKRYQAISQHLSTVTQNWKVGFEYQPGGIRIEGSLYPVLKMDWVTGSSLSSWLDNNIHNRQAILEISAKFADVISSLEQSGIAHGDLQHGNLLVTQDKSLRLVDYDGMFVPSLNGLGATEQGHRNYQSPSRTNEFDSAIDRFSAWIIYMSLVALAAHPSLWTELREQGGEYLLLSEEDFKNPAASARFPALLNSPTSEVRGLAQKVLELTSVPVEAVPRLEPVSSVLAATVADATLTAPRISEAQAVHPSWMASHLTTRSALDPITFNDRTFMLNLFARILPVLSIALGTLAILGASTTSMTLAFFGIVMLICIAGLQVSYKRRPEVVRKQPVATQLSELSTLIKAAEKETTKVSTANSSFEAQDANRKLAEKSEKDKCYKRQRAGSSAVDVSMQSRLHQLALEKAKLAKSRQSELDQALQNLRNEHIQQSLARIHLSTVKLEGFGPKLWSNLRDVGVTTAADFIGVRYQTNGQSKIAFIVLKSGGAVRVPGVAQIKATRLEAWRMSKAAAAERNAPTQLRSPIKTAITSRYSNLEGQLSTAEQKVQADAQIKKADLGRALQSELSRLAERERENNSAAALARVSYARQKAAAQSKLASLRPRHESASFEAAAYSGITFVRFLGFAVAGRRT